MDNRSPIGIFDSGVGGLTVVNNILKAMPNESIIYFADSINFPYGTRSEKEIKFFSKRIAKFLISQGVKALIIACNTASSTAINEVKEVAGRIPVFGMIQYGSLYALKTSKNKKIGIISTPLTAKKHAYKNEIQRNAPESKVFEVGSQDLVNLVEDGITQNQYALALAKERLEEPIRRGIDTLVLGCTHFPFLSKVVKQIVGSNIYVIDPSDYLAEKVKEYIEKQGLCNDYKPPIRNYYTTGDEKDFLEKTKIFLEFNAENVKHITI